MTKRFIIYLLFFLFFLNISFGAVEMFDRYDTTIKFLDDETIQINKVISIQNIHTVGIVPGRVEFKISRDGDNIELIDDSLKVSNKYGSSIKHQLIKTKDYYVIAIDVYTPILPGFKYIINIEYKLNFDAKGVLFKSAVVPIKENLDIPVNSGTFKLILEDDKKFTYLSYKDNNTILSSNEVVYKIDDNSPNELEFEYSKIPLNLFDFKGSYIFWITINILLIILLIYEFNKELEGNGRKRRK